MVDDARSPVIDAHTHTFPPDWVSDRSHLLLRDRWFSSCYEAPLAKIIDASSLLEAMDEAGVPQAVMCGWPWTDAGLCREHNDYLAETASASGGRLSWLGTVSPATDDAGRETRRCLDLGASGVGELNADAQGFDIAEPKMLAEVAEVLIAAGKPVLLHTSEPVGHHYPGKGTATPDRVVALLTANPELPVVLAHWGGGLPFYELMPEVRKVMRNVVYDTAASSYLFQPAVFRTVLDIVGPERVLWASDHPVLGMGRFLERTRRSANIRSDEWHAVMAGNAARVYGLPVLSPRNASLAG